MAFHTVFTTSVYTAPNAVESAATANVFSEQKDELIQKPRPLDGLKILVVDDVLDNQILVNHFLMKAGKVQLDFASNGAIAVEKALKKKYDCILMDLQMPIMDGFSATRILRESGYKKPIWALTAHALREERERCFAEGFDEHISKPVDKNYLIAKLATLRH